MSLWPTPILSGNEAACGEPLACKVGVHGEPMAHDAGGKMSSEPQPQVEDHRFKGHGEPQAHSLSDETQQAPTGFAEDHSTVRDDIGATATSRGSGIGQVWEQSCTSSIGGYTLMPGPSTQAMHGGLLLDKGKARAERSPEAPRTTWHMALGGNKQLN